jgi:hypothetical protein
MVGECNRREEKGKGEGAAINPMLCLFLKILNKEGNHHAPWYPVL